MPRRPVPRRVAADAALVKKLPASVRAKGTLVIGVDATYPPNEFLDADGMTVSGMDVDLFDRVAAPARAQAEWVPAPFDQIIHDVNAGTYDVGVSSFTVTGAREAQSTMVTYFSAGTLWAVKHGNPQHVARRDACGLPIAVQSDTTELSDLQARSHTCTAHGQAAIHIDSYQDQDAATAAVVSGHDDATLADSPITAYAIKQTARQAPAARRDLRLRAVRLRAPQGRHGAGQGDRRRAAEDPRQRPVREGPVDLGRAERCDGLVHLNPKGY